MEEDPRDATPTVQLMSLLSAHVGDTASETALPQLCLRWERTLVNQYLTRVNGQYKVEYRTDSRDDVAAFQYTLEDTTIRVRCQGWLRCNLAPRNAGPLAAQCDVLNWFRKTLDANALVLFVLDVQLIGGLMVRLRPVPRKGFAQTSLQNAYMDTLAVQHADTTGCLQALQYLVSRTKSAAPAVAESIRAQLALLYTCLAESGLTVGSSIYLQPTPDFVIRTKRYAVPVRQFLVRADLDSAANPVDIANAQTVNLIAMNPATRSLVPPNISGLSKRPNHRPSPAQFKELMKILGFTSTTDGGTITPNPAEILSDMQASFDAGQAAGVGLDSAYLDVQTPAEAALQYLAKHPPVDNIDWLETDPDGPIF